MSEGLHATMCQLNPSLDILVISTTLADTRSKVYKGIHKVKLATIQYDTRDANLTCSQKLTRVSLIYCTEPTIGY